MRFDPARDTKGLAIAIREILEEDFARGEIERQAEQASAATRARLLAQIPPRTLSPGYYRFADHLLWIEGEHRAGIILAARELAAVEAIGLRTLIRARSDFEYAHPACGGCGVRQRHRFCVECSACGIKFRRKGK